MEAMRKTAVNYGLVLGLFLIVTTTVMYSIDISLFTTSWVGIVNIIILTGFGVVAAVKNKKMLGGFLTFKETFTSFLITVAVGSFISILFNILLFNVIDPEAKGIITENLIKYTVTMMEKFGTKPADMNKIIEDMRNSDSFGTVGQLKGYAFNLVLYSIIGLVTALIIRRERPQSI